MNKTLPVETHDKHKVIPIVLDGYGMACPKCYFKDMCHTESIVKCTPKSREDGLDVYFVDASIYKECTSEQPTLTVTYENQQRTLADSACAIIHSTFGKVLTVTRRNTDILCLPGGKVDPGETALDAIVREVAEETGLHLRKELFRPIYSEIVVGDDLKDFYCTTYVYTVAVDEHMFAESWSVEEGITVDFATWNELFTAGMFVEYNKRAEENFRKWQAT